MNRKIVLAAFLINSLFCLAQNQYTSHSKKAIDHYEAGLKNYRLYYFDVAEYEFLKAIKADELFVEPYIVLARTYLDSKQPEKALEYYAKGLRINPMFYTLGFLEKGEIEIRLGRYEDALESFQSLLAYEKKNIKLIQRGERGIKQAKFCIKAEKNPVKFNPIRLSDAINTKDDEYWPSLSADEQTLVFTRLVGSAEKKFMQEDFFISTKNDTSWTLAKNVGKPLNTPDNEGAQSISADGKIMVYTVCNRRGVYGRCDLYFSEKKGDLWSNPQNLGPVINTKHKETQPGISADGREIYFASDREGTMGGLDIWVTHYLGNGQWSEPENLGDSINTPGNESSPFIHQDNSTLYYSSDYLIGMGGFDIFMAKKDVFGNWGKAVNIGYPINTFRDEIGLIINSKGNRAYYSSNIDTAWGRDIFWFDLPQEIRPQEVSYVHGKVYDITNNKRLEASFELYNLADNKLVSKSSSDPYTGEFLVSIPTNNDYMLNVSKEGYLFYSENFSLRGTYHLDEPFIMDVPMQPIQKGKTIILRNIFFETDAYQLKEASKLELLKVVSLLQENPKVNVEISGHTDNVGSVEYNNTLSEKRARSVVDYLIANGISTDRLVAKGYGMSKPVDTNETAKGRANNRRTELTVL
jgi:outer membrane protein OmpA-like peptidoglycan-associated protein